MERMKKLQKILRMLIFFSTVSASAQTICIKENLVGQWKQVESIPGIYSNVDSLKRVMGSLTRSIGTMIFNKDNTYTYSFLDTADKKKKPFKVDSSKCQIILGTKRKAVERSNLEIMYIDEQYLIFKEDNNPKGVITHLLVRL
jgi:hypothetical protein